MLQITKLSFEKGFKWGFIYNGFKISITVKDDELMRHIDGEIGRASCRERV